MDNAQRKTKINKSNPGYRIKCGMTKQMHVGEVSCWKSALGGTLPQNQEITMYKVQSTKGKEEGKTVRIRAVRAIRK